VGIGVRVDVGEDSGEEAPLINLRIAKPIRAQIRIPKLCFTGFLEAGRVRLQYRHTFAAS
jgi:hypothetical protein